MGNSKGTQFRGALNFFQLNLAEEKNLLEVQPIRLKDSKLSRPAYFFCSSLGFVISEEGGLEEFEEFFLIQVWMGSL